MDMTATTSTLSPASGHGSAGEAPGLPDGFADTFGSYLVNLGDLRLHAVIGGDGPPVLLVPGWPQTWYAWRLVMPGLARHHRVIAVDPRGVGLSDQPQEGYDTGALAADLVRLMAKLGYRHFSLAGHDIGMWIGYALGADHPGVLDRLAVAEAVIPGIAPAPSIVSPSQVNARLWHFGFNRLPELNEQLVRDRERLFFGYQFASKAASPEAIPPHAVDVYVDAIAASPGALHASFACYRALDTTMEQNTRRATRKLDMPVLALAGAQGNGDIVAATMRLVADDVTSAIIGDCGHYPAEEQPERTLEVLLTFLRAGQPL